VQWHDEVVNRELGDERRQQVYARGQEDQGQGEEKGQAVWPQKYPEAAHQAGIVRLAEYLILLKEYLRHLTSPPDSLSYEEGGTNHHSSRKL
jgi:hypothetical protein